MYLKLLGDDATGEQQEPTPRPKVLRGQNVSLAGLERCLREYLDTPMTEAFDMAGVPEKELVPVEASKPGAPGASGSGDLSGDLSLKSDFEEALQQIPEFADLGPLFKSCDAVELVEKETEYTVSCVKHIFASHVVLQFDMTNTIEEQVLEDVSVDVDLAEAEAYEEVLTIPATRLPYGVVAQTYVLLAYEQGTMPFGRMVSTLKFVGQGDRPEHRGRGGGRFRGRVPAGGRVLLSRGLPPAYQDLQLQECVGCSDPDTEVVDEYGIGQRDSLQDAWRPSWRLSGWLPARARRPCRPTPGVTSACSMAGRRRGERPGQGQLWDGPELRGGHQAHCQGREPGRQRVAACHRRGGLEGPIVGPGSWRPSGWAWARGWQHTKKQTRKDKFNTPRNEELLCPGGEKTAITASGAPRPGQPPSPAATDVVAPIRPIISSSALPFSPPTSPSSAPLRVLPESAQHGPAPPSSRVPAASASPPFPSPSFSLDCGLATIASLNVSSRHTAYALTACQALVPSA